MKEHRNHNESESESSSSRKGSLDIVVPSSAAAISDAPKSPLGQVQQQESVEIDVTEDDGVTAGTGTITNGDDNKKTEEVTGEVTKPDDDDSHDNARITGDEKP